MVVCAVPGCKNSYRNKACSLFTIPKNKVYMKAWLDVCSPNIKSINCARICSDHFRPECFKPKTASEAYLDKMLNREPRKIRTLFPNAIPTENLPLKCQKSKENREPIAENTGNLSETSAVTNVSETPHLNKSDSNTETLPKAIIILKIEPANSSSSISPNCDTSVTNVNEHLHSIEDESNTETLPNVESESPISSQSQNYDTMSEEEKIKLLETKDKMLETKDEMLETKDKMLEMKDKMLEMRDEMLAKMQEQIADLKSKRRRDWETHFLECIKMKEREERERTFCRVYKSRLDCAQKELACLKQKKLEMLNMLKNGFSSGKIQVLLYPRRQPRWSQHDNTSAIFLKPAGSKTYEFLFPKQRISNVGLKYFPRCSASRFSSDESLGISTSLLPYRPEDNLVRLVSRGNLKNPSQKMFKATEVLNEKFKKFHGTTFSKEVKHSQSVALRTNDKLLGKLDLKFPLYHVRMRADIRQKVVNQYHYTLKKNKSKSQKEKIEQLAGKKILNLLVTK